MPPPDDPAPADPERPLSTRARLLILVPMAVVLFAPPIAGVVTVLSGGPLGVALALFFSPFLIIGVGWIGAGAVAARRELAVRREAMGKE